MEMSFVSSETIIRFLDEHFDTGFAKNDCERFELFFTCEYLSIRSLPDVRKVKQTGSCVNRTITDEDDIQLLLDFLHDEYKFNIDMLATCRCTLTSSGNYIEAIATGILVKEI